MIPPTLFDTEEQLFKDMSSCGEGEDWTSIRQYNRKNKTAKRTHDSSSRSIEASELNSRSSNASGGEERTRKKPKFSGDVVVEELEIPPRKTVRTPTIGSSSHNESLKSVLNTPSNTHASSIADSSVSGPHPRHTMSPEPIRAAKGKQRFLPALPDGDSLGSLSGPSSAVAPLPDVEPPAKRSSSGGSDRAITKEALLRQNTVNMSKILAGKKRKGGAANLDKTKQLFYSEYVVQIMDRLNTIAASTKILAGVVLFMVVNEPEGKPISIGTQRRVDLVFKHGGLVQPRFDPEVTTHIICDLPSRLSSTKKTIKRCLDGIAVDDVPWRIRIVPWEWVPNSINSRKLVDQLKAEMYHGRMRLAIKPSTPPPNRRSFRARTPIDDFDETPDRPTRRSPDPDSPTITRHAPQGSASGTSFSTTSDPLASFYENAIYGDDDDDDEDDITGGGVPEKIAASSTVTSTGKHYKGYACQNIERSKGVGLNDDIIVKLQELLDIHDSSRNKEDQWKVLAYRKAIGSLRRCEERITLQNLGKARHMNGIGEKTAKKIAEIIATGGLQRIQFEQTEEHKVCKVLCGIYGVGATTAYQWYRDGIRTLDDVRDGKGGLTLSENQKIGLQFYDDLQDRMPRSEAGAIFEKIKVIAHRLDPNLLVEIMGSYRRGSADCGDIDILITRCTDDGRTHRGVLPRLLRQLEEEKLVTHTLAAPDDYGALEAKFSGLCRLSDDSTIRRIDILTIPYEQMGASLIYFTGDDIFNRSMRLLARHKGMSLNQRGLFNGVVRDPKTGLKECTGTLVASRTEEEIFKILGVPWQLPHERVRSK
ncbi:hypothetical protein FRB95_003417 [Tulasnella sp. JGI-2019a]|nr:hypothetical protein FRB95_003417 [Tulasnella sp. JGI-2019a]